MQLQIVSQFVHSKKDIFSKIFHNQLLQFVLASLMFAADFVNQVTEVLSTLFKFRALVWRGWVVLIKDPNMVKINQYYDLEHCSGEDGLG